MDDHKVSKEVLFISSVLDGLSFTGTDQNPKGIRDRLFCLSSYVRKLETSYRELPESHFTHSYWDCKDSITGKCVYTTDLDSCIFCGQPDERK